MNKNKRSCCIKLHLPLYIQANAAMFWALAPLLGALVSPLIGESLSKATVRALPLAVIGVILVSQPPILFGGAEGKFNGLGIFLGISQVWMLISR